MNDFETLKQEDRIQEVSADKAKARGLLKRSERRFENQKNREVSDKTAFEILESIYESLREAIEAGMAADGFKSEDHVSTIAYAENRLEFPRSQINKLQRFRKLRNESRYEAREITQKEAEQILETADETLPKIHHKVKQKI